ncbi:MAG: putative Alpha/beta hydrolase, partial [Paucimonas sp.]|nr:putative Alpha/beta hydrolase [Paucimonas sp.]
MATPQTAAPRMAQLDWNGRPLQLEYQWVGDLASTRPVVVFLHEGLGSVAMWKDYPDQFCRAFGLRGLVYSRYGHGNSSTRPADEALPMDFMERQATEVLPLLLRELDIERPWLFGHSDGASIALIYAARLPDQLAGATVVAPHILVEDLTVAGIAAARAPFEN